MKSRGPDSARDETVDMARGFALFGILITNAAVLTGVLTSDSPLTPVRLWSHDQTLDRIADIDRRVPVHLLAADRERTDRAGAYRSPLVTCAFLRSEKTLSRTTLGREPGIAGTGVSPEEALFSGVDSLRHTCPASVVATRLPVRGTAVR